MPQNNLNLLNNKKITIKIKIKLLQGQKNKIYVDFVKNYIIMHN